MIIGHKADSEPSQTQAWRLDVVQGCSVDLEALANYHQPPSFYPRLPTPVLLYIPIFFTPILSHATPPPAHRSLSAGRGSAPGRAGLR